MGLTYTLLLAALAAVITARSGGATPAMAVARHGTVWTRRPATAVSRTGR